MNIKQPVFSRSIIVLNTCVYFLAVISVLLTSLDVFSHNCLASETFARRPNIIFIYADDLGYGDLGCYGNKSAKTPHLDRLAKEGTRFTQFYVSHCLCSPTRCSAVTGQYPSRHRIFSYLGWLRDNTGRHMPNFLDPHAPSLPKALQCAGYKTAMIGKWHLGGGSGHVVSGSAINDPNAPQVQCYGFDYARTSFGNSATWMKAVPWPNTHDIYPYKDKNWLRWSSRAIVDDTITFLENHRKQNPEAPFYVNVWLKDPHEPFWPTEEMLQPFENIEDPLRTYLAVIHFMDQQVGRLLKRVDELGLRDNTLVLFSSDNGAPERFGGSNQPLRGWKWHIYEGGIRVPLIVRWPNHVPAGRVDEQSVLNIVDFAPTLSKVAGAEIPLGYHPDGVDARKAFFGQPFERSKPMFWHHPTSRSRNNSPELAMRHGKWKLLMNVDGSQMQLYNLDTDVAEKNNIVGDHPEVARKLREKLWRWFESLPGNNKLPMPFGSSAKKGSPTSSALLQFGH